MNKHKRLRKLLSAQEKVHGLAVAAAARERARLEDARAEQDRLMRNLSGENDLVPPGLVQAICSIGHRTRRIEYIAAAVERQSEMANHEGRLARQLQRLVSSGNAAAQREQDARDLVEQLEGIALRAEYRATQVSPTIFAVEREGD